MLEDASESVDRLKGGQGVCRRTDIGIFRRHIEEIDRMRRCGTVVDRVLRDEDAQIIGERVDHAAANASACRTSGHNERVGAEVDQITGEWSAEERAWMLLRQQNVL